MKESCNNWKSKLSASPTKPGESLKRNITNCEWRWENCSTGRWIREVSDMRNCSRPYSLRIAKDRVDTKRLVDLIES